MFAAFFLAVQAGGWLSDIKGKLPIVGVGCALMCVGAGLVAGPISFPFLLTAMLLMGVGGGFAEGVASAAVSDLYGGSRRTAMLNWSQVVFAVGAVSSPVAVGRMLQVGLDWRLAYIGAALVCGAACAAAFAAAGHRPRMKVPDGIADPSDGPAGGPLSRWRDLVCDPPVFWLSVGLMLYVGAECGQANWLAVLFKHDLQSSRSLAASSVAYFWAGIGIGRMIATRLARHISDLAIIRGALVLGAAAQASLLLVHSPAAALANVVVLGCCLAPTWPTVLGRAGKLYPMQSGTVFGIIVAAGALGAAIFPPAVGRLADILDIRSALWLCFALLVADVGIFFWPSRRRS